MAVSERQIQLQNGVVATVFTQDVTACISLRTTPTAQGFDVKGFLLHYGLEEHKHFHLLLKQFEATIELGLDCQSYCMKADQTDDFLAAINQLIVEYFPHTHTLGNTSS